MSEAAGHGVAMPGWPQQLAAWCIGREPCRPPAKSAHPGQGGVVTGIDGGSGGALGGRPCRARRLLVAQRSAGEPGLAPAELRGKSGRDAGRTCGGAQGVVYGKHGAVLAVRARRSGSHCARRTVAIGLKAWGLSSRESPICSAIPVARICSIAGSGEMTEG